MNRGYELLRSGCGCGGRVDDGRLCGSSFRAVCLGELGMNGNAVLFFVFIRWLAWGDNGCRGGDGRSSQFSETCPFSKII